MILNRIISPFHTSKHLFIQIIKRSCIERAFSHYLIYKKNS